MPKNAEKDSCDVVKVSLVALAVEILERCVEEGIPRGNIATFLIHTAEIAAETETTTKKVDQEKVLIDAMNTALTAYRKFKKDEEVNACIGSPMQAPPQIH